MVFISVTRYKQNQMSQLMLALLVLRMSGTNKLNPCKFENTLHCLVVKAKCLTSINELKAAYGPVTSADFEMDTFVRTFLNCFLASTVSKGASVCLL